MRGLSIFCAVWLGFTLSLKASAQILVTDFQNRDVRLNQPAQRIIALAPHIVENVFSAGAGDKLVGVVAYSNFPDEARKIEQVGNFQSWSLEKIITLKPDLVLLWGSGNNASNLKNLERMGLPVYVSELRRLEDIPRTIRAIGMLADTSDTSELEAQRFETQLTKLKKQYLQPQPVSVFYQIWNEPLQTVNGQHMISDLISLCGGENIFSDVPLLAPRISIEAVLQKNPDAIVASGMGEARPEWLDDWRRFPSLTAVENEQLFYIPPDHLQRPTMRLLLGAQSLCEKLSRRP